MPPMTASPTTPPTSAQLNQIRSRRRGVRRYAATTVAAKTITRAMVTIRLENSMIGWIDADAVSLSW